MDLKENPINKQIEKGKRGLFGAAFIMGAFPFVLMMGLQIAAYAGIILLVCGICGLLLAVARRSRF